MTFLRGFAALAGCGLVIPNDELIYKYRQLFLF